MNQSAAKGTFAGVLAILLWSTTVGLGRLTSEVIGALPTAFFVYGSGGLVLLAFFAARGMLGPEIWKVLTTFRGALLLLLFVVNQIAFYLALGGATTRMASMQMSLVNYLWPTLTILFSLQHMSNRARSVVLLAALLSLTGVIVSLSSDVSALIDGILVTTRENSSSMFFALVAAFSWAVYSRLVRIWPQDCPEAIVPVYMLACAGAVFLLSKESLGFERLQSFAVFILFLNALGSSFGYLFWTYGMKYGNSVLLAALANAIPILSIFVSSVLLSTELPATVWFGAFAVVVGACICQQGVQANRDKFSTMTE